MMSMDMTWVIVLLGLLLMVLVAVPLVGMHLLAAREDRGHRSRKVAQEVEAEALDSAPTRPALEQ